MATNKRITAPSGPRSADWVNPLDNPDKANADIKNILDSVMAPEMPVMPLPADDLVVLPGGIVRKGQVIKNVTVKELTGEDEEALARASQSLNAFHFLDRLLKCGTVSIGGEPSSQTGKLLDSMLIGDREYVMMGIRRATYGDKIEIEKWKCPSCTIETSLCMDLDDIPVSHLKNPAEDVEFKVPFRKGGFALVRLATGSDQVAVFDKQELTQAQRETILLQKCVMSIVDSSGVEHQMVAAPGLALSMSVPDRHAVLNELRKRQPGPKYDEIKYKCENCSEDVLVAVGIGDLFLDFRWYV